MTYKSTKPRWLAAQPHQTAIVVGMVFVLSAWVPVAAGEEGEGEHDPEIVLSKEWSYVDENGHGLPFALQPDMIDYSSELKKSGIWEKWPLKKSYFPEYIKHIEAHKYPLTIKKIRGTYIRLPPEDANLEDVAVYSLLDVPITIKLDSTSAWEAFKTFAIAVNENCPPDWLFNFEPNVTFSPPREFMEPKKINVNFENTPARIVACEIIRQYSTDSLTLTYSYANEDAERHLAHFSIFYYENKDHYEAIEFPRFGPRPEFTPEIRQRMEAWSQAKRAWKEKQAEIFKAKKAALDKEKASEGQ